MPPDKRRRSRSRSKKKTARAHSSSGSPSARRKQKGKARASSGKEKAEESRRPAETARSNKAKSVAAAADSDEDESGNDGSGKFAWEDEESSGVRAQAAAGGMSLEARIALLEVENETLKAENQALKRRLVEALRGGAPAGRAPQAVIAAKPGQSQPAEAAAPAPSPPDDPRRARLAAAAADAPSDRAQARRREREEVAEPAQRGDADMHANAVMLVNGAMEAYNEPVPNNIPLEKRLPLVQEKLDRFLDNFGSQIQILDLKSGGAVIRDRKAFTMRYGCVFRESGSKLKGTVHKRFYFDASGGKPTYSLDFEMHERLVTATPGTPPDGKLGVREPRTEHLTVLYEEKGGKLTRMWIRADTEKLGLDPTAGEDVLVRTDAFKAFEAKIAECKGGKAGEFIFHNYHNTPTIG